MDGPLRWGIIGTGKIADAFARGLGQTDTGDLVAVASRTEANAERFGETHGVGRRHGSYDALVDDPGVDAVYVSTPHPMHAEWAIRCAEAGKHVLCEKPMTLNEADTMAVVEAARRSDVFLMEAFMYRCHPQTERLVGLLRSGVIGDVKLVRATFGFRLPHDPEERHLANGLGGGGILDVGCYTVSMSRLVAATALGVEVAEPREVCTPSGTSGPRRGSTSTRRRPCCSTGTSWRRSRAACAWTWAARSGSTAQRGISSCRSRGSAAGARAGRATSRSTARTRSLSGWP